MTISHMSGDIRLMVFQLTNNLKETQMEVGGRVLSTTG